MLRIMSGAPAGMDLPFQSDGEGSSGVGRKVNISRCIALIEGMMPIRCGAKQR
jgi:hypothetical protein